MLLARDGTVLNKLKNLRVDSQMIWQCDNWVSVTQVISWLMSFFDV